MNWGIFSIVIVLLISCCNAVGVVRLDTSGKVTETSGVRFDIKEKIGLLEPKPDPITYACIYDDGMTEFDVVKSDDRKGVLSLSEKLSNGRDLSLFFLGVGNTIFKKDSRFLKSLEWFIHSGTNICYIAFNFENYEATIYNLYHYIKETLETNRVEFVAREAGDLVLNVRKKCMDTQTEGCLMYMSQVTVVGYSLGGHVGAYACRYLYEKTGEQVKKLIGLDPAAISFFMDSDKNYIKSGDAEYVQVIHTSYFGTQLRQADSDIYINSENWISHSNHRLAVELHELISAKKLILIASESGNGKVINLQKNFSLDPDRIQIADDECLVGVYNKGDKKNFVDCEEDRPIYEVEFPNKSMRFY